MVDPEPPRPPWSWGEVLGIVRLPNDLIRALLARFRVTREDGGPLSTDKWSVHGIHYLLGNPAYSVELVPAFEQVVLIQVNYEGMVYLLHLLLSIPVGL